MALKAASVVGHGVGASARAPRAPRRVTALAPSLRQALERSADDAATRALRGDLVSTSQLGTGVPARARVTGSPGAPLPFDLRGWLETSFGADLGAVRLHTDASAVRAARERGAAGFAAGRDVFLATPAHGLRSERGRRVLAHEVAHTLQQTGRRGPDGRIRATDIDGDAEPQHVDDFVGYADRYGLFSSTYPSWDDIKKAYASVAGIASHIAIVNPHVPPMLPAHPDAAKDIAKAAATAPDDVLGLYVDALKYIGGDDQARALLIAKPATTTAWRSKSFYEAVHGKSLAWLPGVASAQSFLATYYPAKLVDAYRTYFFAPGLPPADLDDATAASKSPATPFHKRTLAELARLTKATGLIANELETAAVFAMLYLDDDRLTWMPKLLDVARKAYPTRSWYALHREVARRFTKDEVKSGDLVGTDFGESIALYRGIHASVKDAAVRAVAYWDRVDRFATAGWGKKGFEDVMTDVEVASIVDKLKADKRFAKIPTVLAKVGTEIFARPKGDLPSAAVFKSKVIQQRAAIQQLHAHFGIFIADLARTGGTGKEMSPDGLLFGFAENLLTHPDYALARYDAVNDEKLAASGAADERVATRIRLAAQLRNIGVRFGWDAVRDAGDGVFHEGPQVALIGDWKHDKAGYGMITDDFRNSPIGGWFFALNLTPSHLDLFAFGGHYDALTSAITGLLTKRGSDFSPTNRPILADAVDEAEKAQKPRRYSITAETADAGMVAKNKPTMYIDWSNALERHSKWADLQAKGTSNEAIIYPSSPPSGTVIVWFMPGMDRLAALLSPLFPDKWMLANGAKAPVPDPKTHAWEWLDLLGTVTMDLRLAGRAVEVADIQGKVESAMVADLDAKRVKAHAAGRLASTHMRRVLVGEIEPILRSYDRRSSADWNTADNVFDAIRAFSKNVYPESDQLFQVTALVYELAPALKTAFGPQESLLGTSIIDRYDIVNPLLRLVWGARSTWWQVEFAHRRAVKDAKPGEVVPENPIVEIASIGRSQLIDNSIILAGLERTYTAYVEKGQKTFGITATKNGSIKDIYLEKRGWALIRWKMNNTEIKEGADFQVLNGWPTPPRETGTYTLKTIHESFTYHHPFGGGDTLGIDWKQGAAPGDALLLDGSGKAMVPSGKPLLTLHRLHAGGFEEYTITDRDLLRLDLLSETIGVYFSFQYMEGAGNFITWYANAVLDVLEFIFPWMTPIRFVATLMQMLTSPEAMELYAAFREDGMGAFTKIFGEFSKLIHFDDIANFLLFDADFTQSKKFERTPTQRQNNVIKKGGMWAAIGRLLSNIVQIGLKVWEGLVRIVKKIQIPVRQAQLWVLRHPVVGFLLDLVERAWEFLSSIGLERLEEMAEGVIEGNWKQMIETEVKSGVTSLMEKGRDMLDSLREFEMPSEIVEPGLLVDAIIDMGVKAAGAKYRKGIEGVRLMLQTINVWNDITGFIGKQLHYVGLDPNVYYQQAIRPPINKWFTELRDDLVGGLVKVLNQIPFLSQLTAPAGTPMDFSFTGFGFDEYPMGEKPAAAPGSVAIPRPSGGDPLPGGVRARAEGSFGHDFGHVRLHRGPDAAHLTSTLSAQGLTSGSHVYLRPGLGPRDGLGQQVLHHELAHVLQQTGPRPLGVQHSAAPSVGTPGRGLAWDPGREAAADAAAARTSARGIASSPISVGGRAGGVQPAYTTEFLRGFLKHMHSEADIKESKKELDDAGKVTLDAASQTTISAVGKALKKSLEKGPMTFAAPFNHAKKEFMQLAHAQWPEIEKVLPRIAARALTNVRSTKKTSAGGKTYVPYLDPAALKTHLERELYAATSMAVVFEIAVIDGPAEIKKRPIVKNAAPITSVECVSVYLPFLAPGTETDKIWAELVTKTFGGTKPLSADDHKLWMLATKLVLGKTGPQVDTYDTKDFKLSARRAKVVRGQRDRIGLIAKDEWPTAADYVKTKPSAVGAKVRQYGLRMGTYKDPVPGVSTVTAEDRDAHHTVQFLLLEYFENNKRLQPFPFLKTVDYPGVVATGSHVDKLKDDPREIKVGKYFPDRGGLMPTVWISRHTHQSGVHYRSETVDDEENKPNSRSTQGAAIHNFFMSRMGEYAPLLGDTVTPDVDPKEVLKALAKKKKTEQNDPVGMDKTGVKIVTVAKLRERIVNAAQATYVNMWAEMKEKLKKRLADQEVAYFNTSAEAKGSTERMDAALILKEFDEVVRLTEEGIGSKSGAGFAP